MYADITKPPAALPTAQLQMLREDVLLLPPLSRRGHGPGLIILTEKLVEPLHVSEGTPSPLIKWAEEGYTVAQLHLSAFEGRSSEDILNETVAALNRCEKCEPKGKIGLVGMLPH